MLQQLTLMQDFFHAKGRKGFCFTGDPEHYDSLVTVYHEKTASENLSNGERFTILGSLLDGEAKNMYKDQLHMEDKTAALEIVWRTLEIAFGYRDTDSLTKIYERSNGPVVENTIKGLKELQKDLIFCMGKERKSEIATLDNPALVNNFIKRLPQRFLILPCIAIIHANFMIY